MYVVGRIFIGAARCDAAIDGLQYVPVQTGAGRLTACLLTADRDFEAKCSVTCIFQGLETRDPLRESGVEFIGPCTSSRDHVIAHWGCLCIARRPGSTRKTVSTLCKRRDWPLSSTGRRGDRSVVGSRRARCRCADFVQDVCRPGLVVKASWLSLWELRRAEDCDVCFPRRVLLTGV